MKIASSSSWARCLPGVGIRANVTAGPASSIRWRTSSARSGHLLGGDVRVRGPDPDLLERVIEAEVGERVERDVAAQAAEVVGGRGARLVGEASQPERLLAAARELDDRGVADVEWDERQRRALEQDLAAAGWNSPRSGSTVSSCWSRKSGIAVSCIWRHVSPVFKRTLTVRRPSASPTSGIDRMTSTSERSNEDSV